MFSSKRVTLKNIFDDQCFLIQKFVDLFLVDGFAFFGSGVHFISSILKRRPQAMKKETKIQQPEIKIKKREE